MINSPIDIIPTLILVGGDEAKSIVDEYKNEYTNRLGSDGTVIIRHLRTYNDIFNYLTDPLDDEIAVMPSNIKQRSSNIKIHDDWNLDEVSINTILFAEREWLHNHRGEENPEADRQLTAIIYENVKAGLNDGDFRDFFNWISSLEFIRNTWWVDSQTQEYEITIDSRRQQAKSMLHSLSWDRVSSLLIGSDFINSRNFSGPAANTIGSLNISEVDFDNDSLLQAVYSLVYDSYLFPKKDEKQKDKYDEFCDKLKRLREEYPESLADISSLNEFIKGTKEILHYIFSLKSIKYKSELIMKLIKLIDSVSPMMEIIVEKEEKNIEMAKESFINTLQKYYREPPIHIPPPPPPKEKTPIWPYILVGVIIILAILYLLFINPELLGNLFSSRSIDYANIAMLLVAGNIIKNEGDSQSIEDIVTDNDSQEKPPYDMIVLMRKYQDVLKNYLDSLYDQEEKHLPHRVKILKKILCNTDIINGVSGHLKQNESEINDWILQMIDLIDTYPDFDDLYGIWLNKIITSNEDNEVIIKQAVQSLVKEFLKKETVLNEASPLKWRIGKNDTSYNCIITMHKSLMSNEPFKNVIFEASAERNKIKVIHIGQYIER